MIQFLSEARETRQYPGENRDMKMEIMLQQFNLNTPKPEIYEPRSVKEILGKMGLLIQK